MLEIGSWEGSPHFLVQQGQGLARIFCPNRSHAGVCNKLGTKAGSEMARARTLSTAAESLREQLETNADAKDAECKRTLFPPAFQKWLGTLLRLNKLKVPSAL